MCPVRAARVAKVAVQVVQRQVVVLGVVWAVLRCFLRSAVVAKEAEQVLPQGMSHWQMRLEEGLGGEAVCEIEGSGRAGAVVVGAVVARDDWRS
jgi:hypothetical protein